MNFINNLNNILDYCYQYFNYFFQTPVRRKEKIIGQVILLIQGTSSRYTNSYCPTTYRNVTNGAHQNRFMAAPTSSPTECDMQIVPKLLCRASFV